MTRAEADVLVQALEEFVHDTMTHRRDAAGAMFASADAVDKAVERRSYLRMNASRERLIDRLCGEPATDPIPGRDLCDYCGHPKNSATCQKAHP